MSGGGGGYRNHEAVTMVYRDVTDVRPGLRLYDGNIWETLMCMWVLVGNRGKMKAETQIATTLTQINDHYADYEPFERVAEAVIEQGGRRVDYIYEISHENETAELQVSSKYYTDGELVNQSNTTQTYPVEGGFVLHAGEEHELMAFIEANAFADPEVTLGEEYDSMV